MAAPAKASLAESGGGGQLHCESKYRLDENWVSNAYQSLYNRARGGNYYIGGDQDAYGQYNNVDFYICNHYGQGRNYHLDGQWNYVQQYYRDCGNRAYWVMENNGWSWGVGPSGTWSCRGE